MVPEPLRSRIAEFVRDVGEYVDERYHLVEAASPEEVARIRRDYLPRALTLPVATRERILECMPKCGGPAPAPPAGGG